MLFNICELEPPYEDKNSNISSIEGGSSKDGLEGFGGNSVATGLSAMGSSAVFVPASGIGLEVLVGEVEHVVDVVSLPVS